MGQHRKRQRLSEEGATTATAIVEDDLDAESPEEAKEQAESKSQRRSLFVRLLSRTVTTESLTDHFSHSYPLKHATVVLDTVTKESKGYGFVTFADAEDAQRAKDELNGSLLHGRKIRVEVAEPRDRYVDG